MIDLLTITRPAVTLTANAFSGLCFRWQTRIRACRYYLEGDFANADKYATIAIRTERCAAARLGSARLGSARLGSARLG